MRILGISGSPRRGSTTDQLVQAVLAGADGCDTEFVSLSGKRSARASPVWGAPRTMSAR